MAAKNPTVLTMAGGLNKIASDLEAEFSALNSLFGAGKWDQMKLINNDRDVSLIKKRA